MEDFVDYCSEGNPSSAVGDLGQDPRYVDGESNPDTENDLIENPWLKMVEGVLEAETFSIQVERRLLEALVDDYFISVSQKIYLRRTDIDPYIKITERAINLVYDNLKTRIDTNKENLGTTLSVDGAILFTSVIIRCLYATFPDIYGINIEDVLRMVSGAAGYLIGSNSIKLINLRIIVMHVSQLLSSYQHCNCKSKDI